MNAIDFLTKEHDQVRDMVADISDESHQYTTKRKIFDHLAKNLLRHEKMEHKVWYPHFKNKLPDTVKHLIKEEHGAEKAIHKLNELKSETAWEKHFLKFKDDVEHHAAEEENELFPEVKKILSKTELDEIGLKMYEFKKQHPN